MGETYGVPVEEIVEGIKHGVRKVNIDTDLRMATTGALRRFFDENKQEYDPRKFYRLVQPLCAKFAKRVMRHLVLLAKPHLSNQFHVMIWLSATSLANLAR